jgi:two-component system, NtrC family, response regulator AtoC
LIEVVAGSELAVLLLGESGVGKTVVAEALHALSRRAEQPRHRLDGGTPPKLLERQLFGVDDTPGLLEVTAGGTIILREVSEIPLPIQDRLAAAIVDRRASRVGVTGGREYPVDVRFLALSSQDLLGAAVAGRFDPRLFAVLAGVSIVLPPLRERAGEIPRFAARFLAEAAARSGRPRPRLSNDALGLLIRHPFTGNLRELRTLMERACALAGAGFIGSEHLLFESGRLADRGVNMQTATTRRFAPVAPTEPPDSPTEPVSVVIPAAPRAMPPDAPPDLVRPPEARAKPKNEPVAKRVPPAKESSPGKSRPTPKERSRPKPRKR